MQIKLTTTSVLAAILIIGAGGYMIGRTQSKDSPQNPAPATTRTARPTPSTSHHIESTRSARNQPRENTRKDSATKNANPFEPILTDPDSLTRQRAIIAYIDQLGSNDFENAVADFRKMGITESRMAEYGLLLSAWAKSDPYAALQYVQAKTSNPFATNTILTTWAATDPEGAIRWAETHHNKETANPYFASILASLAQSDPTRATDLLTSMPPGVERNNALTAMLPQLLKNGPEAAREWLDNLADPTLKTIAIMQSAAQLAARDPEGTVAWLLANPGDATQSTLHGIYSNWVFHDQEAALKSLASIPDPAFRGNAMTGIISSMANVDPQAAISLMDRFPADMNDNIISSFTFNSFSRDPATAVNQIARISDANQRDMIYRNLVARWINEDPNAAGNWLKSHPMPPQLQQEFHSLLDAH